LFCGVICNLLDWYLYFGGTFYIHLDSRRMIPRDYGTLLLGRVASQREELCKNLGSHSGACIKTWFGGMWHHVI
jgi:hypothetical protein